MIVVLCCYWVLVTYFLSLVCLFTFTPGPGSVACCLEVTCGDILESCITRAGRILEFCFPMLRGRRGGWPRYCNQSGLARYRYTHRHPFSSFKASDFTCYITTTCTGCGGRNKVILGWVRWVGSESLKGWDGDDGHHQLSITIIIWTSSPSH